MKNALTLIMSLLMASAFGQTFSDPIFKDFASPAGDEVFMTQCSFDPDAAAVILRKDATVLPDGHKMFKYCRNRLKILNTNGLDEANIRIRYYHFGEYEKISNIQAVTINYNNDGSKRMSPIQAKDIHYTREDQFYTNITFSMPEVKAGSIIEYSYLSERISYQLVDYWYFQDDLPVLYSTFDYTLMPGAEFSYRVLKPKNRPISLKEYKTEGRLVFMMQQMPGITDEAFMDSKRDYLSRVELQMNNYGPGFEREKFVSTWPELTQQLIRDEDFGMMLGKKIPGTEDIVTDAKRIPSSKQRMDLIFRHVQKQLSWNRYVGIYARDKLKTVWDRKTGSAAEINILLLNLLNESGIPATPLLVSDRSHGKVTTTHPFISQFSMVIAYVQIDNREYFLDASGDQSQTELIPEALLNTTAYLVDRKHSRFLTISDPVHYQKRNISIAARISRTGILSGQAFIMDRDYSRLNHARQLRYDKEGYVWKNFLKSQNQMAIDSFVVRNLDIDSLPLEQLIDFRQQLEVSSDYFLLYTNLFGGLDNNPFLSENRYTDINFGCNRTISFNESFEIGEGLTIESMPKPLMLRLPDTGMVFSRLTDLSSDGKRLVVKIKVDINRTLYPPEEYDAVREFFKKMYGMLTEPVLLRKKP
jgi:hypothetical protein